MISQKNTPMRSDAPVLSAHVIYKKMTTYIRLLQSEARVLEPNATALVGLSYALNEIEFVFNYSYTASSHMGTRVTLIENFASHAAVQELVDAKPD